MKILEIEHCRKQFDGVQVLSDISLTVSEGQVVSIIGPSGSGKSTLLRCATLLETMDGGTLKYLGKSAVRDENGRAVYASHAELKEIRSCFGLVFQNFNLFPHYTVMKNITEAPILIQKRDKNEVRYRPGPAGEDGPLRPRGRLSLSTVRRPAAARLHRPGAGHEAEDTVL